MYSGWLPDAPKCGKLYWFRSGIGRVEVPGHDVCIPILFVPRILSRESETRTLYSTSPDYQKKLQLFRYKVLINLSCHDGDSMMINFGRLHCRATMRAKCLGVKLWNFLCSQHLEIQPATIRVKIRCFILAGR